MAKAHTQPGLGPPLAPQSEQSGIHEQEPTPEAAAPSPPATEKARRDTVDLLLDGFEDRPDRPRIRPPSESDKRHESGRVPKGSRDAETQPAHRDLAPTQPGVRQRRRSAALRVLAVAVSLLTIALALWQWNARRPAPSAPSEAQSAHVEAVAPRVEPAAATPTESVAPSTSAQAPVASDPIAAPTPTPTARPAMRRPAAPPTHTSSAPATTYGHDAPADLRGTN